MNKELFEKEVDVLLEMKELLPLSTRLSQVEDLCEKFFVTTEKRPPSFQLDRLGNYLLADMLRDKDIHKVKKQEYPVLSEGQQKLRNRRERRVGDENLDFIKIKEIDTNPNAFKKRTNNKDE